MTPDAAVWQLVLPMILMGVGNACIWAPVSATAMRNLPIQQAGAGSGVYNATRQVGGVLGSAAIAVLMDSRLAHFGLGGVGSPEGGGRARCRRGRATSSRRRWPSRCCCPAVVLLVGFAAALCFERPEHTGFPAAPRAGSSGLTAPDAHTDGAMRRAPPMTSRRHLIEAPAERRCSHASTTRAAMPASAALPQARGS